MEIGLIFLLLISVFIFWFIAKIYTVRILSKYRDMEKLLFDIRDGTRSFYTEKRRARRVKTDISAKLIEKGAKENIKILNLSHTGALLKTTKKLQLDRVIALNIYLPLFPQPIDVKAKVVRIINPETVSGNAVSKTPFINAGIEFINMSKIDRERLIETINLLLNKSGKE